MFAFGLVGFAVALVLSNSVLLTLPLSYCIGVSGGKTQAVTQTWIGMLEGKIRGIGLSIELGMLAAVDAFMKSSSLTRVIREIWPPRWS
ncbi:hypothetical protein H2509_00850 [Stappia sp. F7233]|uniref:Uncharacterized protein n=1 Tax=Stappia albiluteola TaxID=2758565 RepID=A0A839A9Q5_9HYPH|nr:hypothetical protein [Stappia albiluteola]MBA5775667.1 hypothetical protein [Stappia albiluteola]